MGAAAAFPFAPAHAANEKIVAIFHDLAEPFFVFMANAGREAAAKEKVNFAVVDGQESSAKESTDLENALSQRVDGIIVAPTDVKAIVPAVNSAIENKTPLMSVDRRVEGAEQPVPHVGADDVAGGRLQAEWVMKTFPNGGKNSVPDRKSWQRPRHRSGKGCSRGNRRRRRQIQDCR